MFGFLKRKRSCPGPMSAEEAPNRSDEDYNRQKRDSEAYAMALLQKISRKGEACLSEKERAFLKNYAKSSYLR